MRFIQYAVLNVKCKYDIIPNSINLNTVYHGYRINWNTVKKKYINWYYRCIGVKVCT